MMFPFFLEENHVGH